MSVRLFIFVSEKHYLYNFLLNANTIRAVSLQFVSCLFLGVMERRRGGYSIQREILDEEAVDELAEKSESKTSLCDKLKESAR